jgi:hypothetical protein
LRESTRGNRDEQDAVLHKLRSTVLGEHWVDNGGPELTHFVNDTEVDFSESSGHDVEEFAQWFWRVVVSTHESALVKSTIAAGLRPDGNGDAVVTSV